jgi:hypothetical protein
MHRTPAPRLVITGRATSITASSWAWAHGPAGVITTVGAAIALSLPAAEDITEASWAITETPAVQRLYTRTAKGQPTILPPRTTANLTPPQCITANPRPPLTPPQRITANPTAHLTPPQRLVADLMVVVENLILVVENATRAFLLMV